MLLTSASSYDTAGENFYYGFMLGLCDLLNDFYVTSNRESGNGRYDKVRQQKPSEADLQQIIDKKYDTQMKAEGIETIYKHGMAFCGKNVEVTTE